MKHLLFLSITISLLTSCSKDSELEITSEIAAISYSKTTQYRGVFTTLDGSDQAKVFIEIPTSNKPPIARIEFSNGKTILVSGIRNSTSISENTIHFEDSEISFDFSNQNNAFEATITNITYLGKTGDIMAFQHTQRAPVTPIDGTYQCIQCGGSPFLNQGELQTFNFVFMAPDGIGQIATQVTLGATVFNGIGYQDNCNANGIFTTCDIESGDGSTTTTGFLANGNPVIWIGTHLFNNEASGPNDCSGISGNWEWQSLNYGLITGVLASNNGCYQELYSEDFTGFTGAGFTPTPAAGQLDSDIVIVNGLSDGSLAFGGSATTGDFARGISSGGISSGGIFAFDLGGGNMTLGVQPGGSDFTPGEFDFRIRNTTGNSLQNFRITYDIFVNNDQARGNSFNFLYSTDGTNYTPLNSLDYTSPDAASGGGFFAVNRIGNFSATVANGAFIYLRFQGDDISGSGSRDEFALDNILLEGI
ncbi:MAG: hypothetical protein R2776_10180 [Flavobacteriaceae bacterium]|nr:hypothetical protein [Flavobacteriaceae bacterium]